MKTSAYSLDLQDWRNLFQSMNESKTCLDFWLKALFKKSHFQTHNVSKKILTYLHDNFSFDLPQISTMQKSEDGTIKFQIKLEDDNEVETVLIPFGKRYTVCLSTQVGCAMKCSFCYTGTQGLKRNLAAAEIIGQYLLAKTFLLDQKISNIPPRIVLMGQGEPLQNIDQLSKAINIFTDKNLVGLGPKEITLSTVGYLPGIKKLAQLPKMNLALSLHSPFNEERQTLIPLTQKYPIEDVLQELENLPNREKRIITYEYILIKNFNMSETHANGLEKLLSKRRAIINLIPFNPFPGSAWQRPDLDEINLFKEMLVRRKLRTLIRTTKGHDILAACGQLKINKISKENKIYE